jgi:hypothetical protein
LPGEAQADLEHDRRPQRDADHDRPPRAAAGADEQDSRRHQGSRGQRQQDGVRGVQAEQADVAGDEAAGQGGLGQHLQQDDYGEEADYDDGPAADKPVLGHLAIVLAGARIRIGIRT